MASARIYETRTQRRRRRHREIRDLCAVLCHGGPKYSRSDLLAIRDLPVMKPLAFLDSKTLETSLASNPCGDPESFVEIEIPFLHSSTYLDFQIGKDCEHMFIPSAVSLYILPSEEVIGESCGHDGKSFSLPGGHETHIARRIKEAQNFAWSKCSQRTKFFWNACKSKFTHMSSSAAASVASSHRGFTSAKACGPHPGRPVVATKLFGTRVSSLEKDEIVDTLGYKNTSGEPRSGSSHLCANTDTEMQHFRMLEKPVVDLDLPSLTPQERAPYIIRKLEVLEEGAYDLLTSMQNEYWIKNATLSEVGSSEEPRSGSSHSYRFEQSCWRFSQVSLPKEVEELIAPILEMATKVDTEKRAAFIFKATRGILDRHKMPEHIYFEVISILEASMACKMSNVLFFVCVECAWRHECQKAFCEQCGGGDVFNEREWIESKEYKRCCKFYCGEITSESGTDVESDELDYDDDCYDS